MRKLQEDAEGHSIVRLHIAVIGAVLCFIVGFLAGITAG